MTVSELKWAFINEVPVKIKDRARNFECWVPRIDKLICWRDKNGSVEISADCTTRLNPSPSAVCARASDVFFAKKEDADRCHKEINQTNGTKEVS